MSYETVLLEEREPGIWLLTVNRPKALNALWNDGTAATLTAYIAGKH